MIRLAAPQVAAHLCALARVLTQRIVKQRKREANESENDSESESEE